MVSTRLQSNSNSSCGDGTLPSASPETLPAKGSCNIGCITRSSSLVSHQIPCHSKDVPPKISMNILDLPTEIIQKIVSYSGYRTVANIRTVNKKMDQICGSLLNVEFNKLQNSMLARFHNLKAQMPRRESARRQHPLACEVDIVETIYMRLNLLHMTFGKHIEKKLLYFFPGEVLDEVYRILYYIKVTPKLPRPYRVTDELFDLTTMAMEYFKEKLEPNLPEVTYCGSDLITYSPISRGSSAGSGTTLLEESNLAMELTVQSITEEESNSTFPPQPNMVLRNRIRKIKQGMKLYNSQLSNMKRELKGYKTKMADQQKTILDYATRLDENDKKNEEMSRKYSTLLQELNKCKTELQYWRTKSPLNPVCGACGAPVATLPIEDLQALSNQGVVIPMVVVQSINVNQEESGIKNDPEELDAKEINGDNSCSKNKEVDNDIKDISALQAKSENLDKNECSSSKSRPTKPTKRKQVSKEQHTYKRQRGILKLRSKTIKIMK